MILIRLQLLSKKQKKQKDMPTAIIAKTIKGKGVSFHGKPGWMAWKSSE